MAGCWRLPRVVMAITSPMGWAPSASGSTSAISTLARPKPTTTYQVAQPVTSMAPWQDGVVFGTANSNVGYSRRRLAGRTGLDDPAHAPISRVQAAPDLDGILAGNDKGGVTLLTGDGVEQWTRSLGNIRYAASTTIRPAATCWWATPTARSPSSKRGGATVYSGPSRHHHRPGSDPPDRRRWVGGDSP